jgi:hypothetical protein
MEARYGEYLSSYTMNCGPDRQGRVFVCTDRDQPPEVKAT